MARYTFGDVRPEGPTTVVAVVDAAICGFVTTGPSRDEDAADTGEVYALYVDPQYWGRGIGRSLIAEARTQLSGQGLAKAVLWVLAGNERAQRFYRADGWWSDGRRRQEYVWGMLADEVGFAAVCPNAPRCMSWRRDYPAAGGSGRNSRSWVDITWQLAIRSNGGDVPVRVRLGRLAYLVQRLNFLSGELPLHRIEVIFQLLQFCRADDQ
jgi:hypothetical protein